MLGNLFKKKEKPTDEKIKEDRQKWLDEMIARSNNLRRLIRNDESGWKEFVRLLDNYTDKCKRRKVVTPLDTATPETIDILKKLDHEVWFLNFIRRIPAQFIENVEKEIEQVNKEDNDAPAD